MSLTGLSIHQTSYGSLSHYGVYAEKSAITKGTRFGPFQGKLVNTSEIKTYDDNTLMWEVSYYMMFYFVCVFYLSLDKTFLFF